MGRLMGLGPDWQLVAFRRPDKSTGHGGVRRTVEVSPRVLLYQLHEKTPATWPAGVVSAQAYHLLVGHRSQGEGAATP
ncbi:hypothetical protein Hdeb2414_s0006g00199551 [Helianthus debilis subsp. tardiflorus]